MRHVRTILIVDGDPAMRATLREQLTLDGAFAVTEAASAREAELWLIAGNKEFAAVIMDAVLPDGDGHAVCRRLRAGGLSMPVILLNGSNPRRADDDLVTLAKPFRLSELMAHLRTHLDNRARPPIRIGPYELRPDEKTLHQYDANRRIRLTEKEVEILAFLHRSGERAVPRMELLREVWGYHPSVTTHTLETHIYRLRRKMEADPTRARLLVTEAGGYRLWVK